MGGPSDKESSIIGGNTKNVYAIGPTTVIKGDQFIRIWADRLGLLQM